MQSRKQASGFVLSFQTFVGWNFLVVSSIAMGPLPEIRIFFAKRAFHIEDFRANLLISLMGIVCSALEADCQIFW
jgi:hypothetical protein